MPRQTKGGQQKADALLGRFPVTDLAKAVARSGDKRETFLRNFVNGFPQGSYAPLRRVVPRIYGVQPPLFEVPTEGWPTIERTLREITPQAFLANNLSRGSELFQHAREENYVATYIAPQVFRYGRGTAPIGIDFFLTQRERLIFQFPHFRSEALNASEAIVLCSIIQYAYAVGDFAEAEVEIVQFAKSRQNRFPHIICPDKQALLSRDQLNKEIDDVYSILRTLAEGGSAPQP
jgi:hypothetical protein